MTALAVGVKEILVLFLFSSLVACFEMSGCDPKSYFMLEQSGAAKTRELVLVLVRLLLVVVECSLPSLAVLRNHALYLIFVWTDLCLLTKMFPFFDRSFFQTQTATQIFCCERKNLSTF